MNDNSTASNVGQIDDGGPHGDTADTIEPEASAIDRSWSASILDDWRNGMADKAIATLAVGIECLCDHAEIVGTRFGIPFSVETTREIPATSDEIGTARPDTPGEGASMPGGPEIVPNGDGTFAVTARGLFIPRATLSSEPPKTDDKPDANKWDGWTEVGRAWLASGAPLGGAVVEQPVREAIERAVAEGATKAITSRDLQIAAGLDPDAPFEVGAFPAEMRRHPDQLGVKLEPVDPTPEEQRANFDRIASEPRPSAVEIKEALESLEFIDALLVEQQYDESAENVRQVATILDRLGVEVLRQDITADEAAATITRLEAMTSPPADLAELVQEARLTAERRVEHDRGVAALLERMIGALNAERRARVTAEADANLFSDQLDIKTEALADMARTQQVVGLCRQLDEARAEAALRLRQCDEAEESYRHALHQAECNEARRRRTKRKLKRARKLLAEAPTYDDSRRDAGIVAWNESLRTASPIGESVDAIAEALGMRKAGE
jgi:hypothetical protein